MDSPVDIEDGELSRSTPVHLIDVFVLPGPLARPAHIADVPSVGIEDL
jgi:hypothetical protein